METLASLPEAEFAARTEKPAAAAAAAAALWPAPVGAGAGATRNASRLVSPYFTSVPEAQCVARKE